MTSSDIGLIAINNANQIMFNNDSMENLNENLNVKPKSLFKKILLNVIFSTPGLVILVIFYTIFGALLFPLLEVPLRNKNIMSISKSREECLKELWTITERLNVLYERNWTQLVHEQLRRFEGTIIAATKNGLIEMTNIHGYDGLGDALNVSNTSGWSFSDALLYSVTVITTIGHGNLTPQTSGGKIVTMIYALIGVPLMLMCLSSLGAILGKALQTAYSNLCLRRTRTNRRKKRKKQNDSDKTDTESDTDHDNCDGSCNDIAEQQNYTLCKSTSNYDNNCGIKNYMPEQNITHVGTALSRMMKSNEVTTMCNVHSTGRGQPLIKFSPKHYLYENPDQTSSLHMDTSGNIISAPGSPQRYQNIQFQLNNANYCSNSLMYHTATVHGIGTRSKFIPKPIPQEITQLIAESDLGKLSAFGAGENKFNNQNHLIDDIHDVDDDDEDCQNNSHDTPSRIPLITSSSATKQSLNHSQMHYQPEHKERDHKNRNDNNDQTIGSSCQSSMQPASATYNQVPITIILVILVIYIGLGTVIFSIWENWSIIDGAYFCFITLTTIGFGGDLIPKKTFRGTSQLQFYACCAYLVIGLILVAMSFSLLETQLVFKCRRIAVRLKLTKD